jgi:hypothetical protein
LQEGSLRDTLGVDVIGLMGLPREARGGTWRPDQRCVVDNPRRSGNRPAAVTHSPVAPSTGSTIMESPRNRRHSRP